MLHRLMWHQLSNFKLLEIGPNYYPPGTADTDRGPDAPSTGGGSGDGSEDAGGGGGGNVGRGGIGRV
jgi:hypothetical protein